MPTQVDPMRAVTGVLPEGDDSGWAYEIKWDGMRAIGFADAGRLRLQSSNRLEATARFPDVAALAEAHPRQRFVIDGELVAFGPDGRPDFGRLQHRMHVGSTDLAGVRARQQPVIYVVFDLIWLDGEDIGALVYPERRERLADLLHPGPNWTIPEPQIGGGKELFQAVTDRGLEGLIAKQLTSRYEAGRRSGAWRKIKVRRRQELVVGGWLPGEGSRASTLGALLVGYYEDGSFRYAGRVGTGFGEAELRILMGELDRRARTDCPFTPDPPRPVMRQAHWVDPELVVEVTFGEWTADGVLRHPSYVGRRSDKDPRRVIREPSP